MHEGHREGRPVCSANRRTVSVRTRAWADLAVKNLAGRPALGDQLRTAVISRSSALSLPNRESVDASSCNEKNACAAAKLATKFGAASTRALLGQFIDPQSLRQVFG